MAGNREEAIALDWSDGTAIDLPAAPPRKRPQQEPRVGLSVTGATHFLSEAELMTPGLGQVAMKIGLAENATRSMVGPCQTLV